MQPWLHFHRQCPPLDPNTQAVKRHLVQLQDVENFTLPAKETEAFWIDLFCESSEEKMGRGDGEMMRVGLAA